MNDAVKRFTELYAAGPPWEIDRPQPVVMAWQKNRLVSGRVLDCGCGTGHNAIWLAEQGHEVVAFDFIEPPVAVARTRAAERGVLVDFRVQDALKLDSWSEQFDTVIDSGLFHVFPADIRPRYVRGLANVLRPSGRLLLMCFSDRQPGTEGPLRISEAMVREEFADWEIVSLEACRYASLIKPDGPQHDGEGAHAWALVARR